MKNYDDQKVKIVRNWIKKRKIGIPLEELKEMVKIIKELEDKEKAKSLTRALKRGCKYGEYTSVRGLEIIIENIQQKTKERQEDIEWIIQTRFFEEERGYRDCFEYSLELKRDKGNKWLKRLFFYLYWDTKVRNIGSHYASNDKKLLEEITKKCIERDLDEEIVEEAVNGEVRKEEFFGRNYGFSLRAQNQLIDYFYEIQNKI